MNTYLEYGMEQAGKYHSWYESQAGRALGIEQRTALGRAVGDPCARRLLDVGCGTGYFTGWFHHLGFDTAGVDAAPAMIGFARQTQQNPERFFIADAGRLPFADNSFDVLVFATSLEFIAHAASAVREAQRVAASEIFLLLLNPDHPMNIKRKKRDALSGGVFGAACLRHAHDVEILFEADRPGRWNSSCVVAPDHRSYYIMKSVYSPA